MAAAPADYLVNSWNTENGLPSSTVTAITQTPDGYLWVGTYNGLARFDGARFVTFDPVDKPTLGQPRVQDLRVDANGTLWINTFRGGLTSYRNGVFSKELPDQPTFDLHDTLAWSSSNSVTFVTQFGEVLQRDPLDANATWKTFTAPGAPAFQCVDAENNLWFLTHDGHVMLFSQGEFKLLPNDGGLRSGSIYTLVADTQGRVWAGAENEVARWDGKSFVSMTPADSETNLEPRALYPTRSGVIWLLDGDRLRKMENGAWTAEVPQWRGLLGPASGRSMGMHEDRDGGIWFNHYGNGLFHITPDGRYQRQEDLPSDRAGAWFQSSDGGVWVGMDRGGLARLRYRRFHVVGAPEGLPARAALSICQAPDGGMWIGTSGGGLCRWSEGGIHRYSVSANSSANFIFSIASKTGGGAWLSAGEGEDLYEFSKGLIERSSWDVHGIKCILTDSKNRVWMGTKFGIAYSDGHDHRILGTNNVTTLPAVRALAETPDGQIWAGADDGTLYRCEPDKLTPFRPDDALAGEPIYSLYAETNGTLWAGTFRGGLLRFTNGVFSRISARQGLPVDVISQILGDDHGRLWLGTHQGIYCVSNSVLNAAADGQTNVLNYIVYGRNDGMASAECSDGYQPACWHAGDGRLWFTTVRGGAVWVNPNEGIARSKAPPVLIEDFSIDGESVDFTKPVIVPPGRKQLDFRYTALNFDAGDKTRFRYRVDGWDSDWVDCGTLRTLQLRNLPPRDYRFRVIACNNEGVWNTTGAEISFIVKPHVYQTLAFKILVGVLVVSGVSIAARRAATRKYRRQLALLQQQQAVERDRARIANDIHDDIGAGLTQITLLTELARREPEQVNANLERITQSARKLTRAMDEIVWAVDPQHDTFEGLMDYISAYAEDFLRVAGIRCRMDLPVSLPSVRIDAELRYNLFLALKETLNNIVKHANATEVWLRLKIEPQFFTLTVEDNGRGLNGAPASESISSSERLSSGSGMENLRKRLSAVGGDCQVESASGQGTRVTMTVRLKTASSPVMVIGEEGNMN